MSFRPDNDLLRTHRRKNSNSTIIGGTAGKLTVIKLGLSCGSSKSLRTYVASKDENRFSEIVVACRGGVLKAPTLTKTD